MSNLNLPDGGADLPNAIDIGLDFIGSINNKTGTIKTGVGKFDRHFGGLWKSNLYVVCARPSVGKTAVQLQFARNIAIKHRVLFHELEMSSRDLWARIVCGKTQISYKNVIIFKHVECCRCGTPFDAGIF